jgi:drug/metabolite transporter (DMT)-like permease
MARRTARSRTLPSARTRNKLATLAQALSSTIPADPRSTQSAPKPQGPAVGEAPLLGSLLLVAAMVCEASYVVIGKRLAANVSAKRISALVNLWGLALVTPFGLWQALRFDFGAVAPATWSLLLFYSLAASMWAVWLWMTGLRHVPASRAGVFTVMLPVTAAAVGVLFLGEQVSGVQGAAFALALLGVLLATWPGRGSVRIQPA